MSDPDHEISPQPRSISVSELDGLVGREMGLSGWRTITQSEIDAFADVTDDHQFIHVDPARAAAETSFGGAIAHGFLSLSLLSSFGREALPRISERRMGVNYGLDRVRFVSPVRSGARLRARFVLAAAERRSPTEIMMRFSVTVEIEGGTKPALVAEWLTLAVLG